MWCSTVSAAFDLESTTKLEQILTKRLDTIQRIT